MPTVKQTKLVKTAGQARVKAMYKQIKSSNTNLSKAPRTNIANRRGG